MVRLLGCAKVKHCSRVHHASGRSDIFFVKRSARAVISSSAAGDDWCLPVSVEWLVDSIHSLWRTTCHQALTATGQLGRQLLLRIVRDQASQTVTLRVTDGKRFKLAAARCAA